MEHRIGECLGSLAISLGGLGKELGECCNVVGEPQPDPRRILEAFLGDCIGESLGRSYKALGGIGQILGVILGDCVWNCLENSVQSALGVLAKYWGHSFPIASRSPWGSHGQSLEYICQFLGAFSGNGLGDSLGQSCQLPWGSGLDPGGILGDCCKVLGGY